MRTLRAAVVATIAVVPFVLAPTPASADGGAYITFERTHYLPGETAVGEGYVYVPKQHQDLLERGPFYGYLGGTDGSDVRLGTVEFERYGKEEFELHLAFTVPDVVGDYYTVRICNEPCSIAGFREPLTGPISIVHTEREAELLNENTKLGYRNYALGRKLRKAERQLAELQATLADETDVGDASTDVLTAEVAQPSPASHVLGIPATVQEGRPLVEAWAMFGLGASALVAVGAIALALIFSRRSATAAPHAELATRRPAR